MSEISIFRNQEFNKYFDQQCNKKWLQSEMPKKILRPADYEDFISWPLAKNCRSEITTLVEHRAQTQKHYRQANIKLNEKRKALVENFLTDPRLKAVKDRYENIKQCEASAIH